MTHPREGSDPQPVPNLLVFEILLLKCILLDLVNELPSGKFKLWVRSLNMKFWNWSLSEIFKFLLQLECNWYRLWGRRHFPNASVVRNLPAHAGDARHASLIPGLGRSPGEGNGNPLQYSCLGNLTNRGAYSPWGCRESDTTEQTSKWAWGRRDIRLYCLYLCLGQISWFPGSLSVFICKVGVVILFLCLLGK